MERSGNNVTNMLKGVSTLDATRKTLKQVSSHLTLFLLSNIAYPARGHSTINGDTPAISAYNGDGKTVFVVLHSSEGVWYKFITSTIGEYEFQAIQFGLAGDETVVADYDGDSETDIAIRRQNVWHLLLSETGYRSVTFGNSSTKAIATLQK